MAARTPHKSNFGSRLRHKVGRLRGLTVIELGFLAEAAAALITARITLATTRFSHYARREGGFVAPDLARSNASATAELMELTKQIGWAVRSAANNLPFNMVCLPQAMAARSMLKRRGIGSVMHFGTGWEKDKPLFAHAWLDSSGIAVTGFPIGEEITEVSCLV
jgi:hypothetical protein